MPCPVLAPASGPSHPASPCWWALQPLVGSELLCTSWAALVCEARDKAGPKLMRRLILARVNALKRLRWMTRTFGSSWMVTALRARTSLRHTMPKAVDKGWMCIACMHVQMCEKAHARSPAHHHPLLPCGTQQLTSSLAHGSQGGARAEQQNTPLAGIPSAYMTGEHCAGEGKQVHAWWWEDTRRSSEVETQAHKWEDTHSHVTHKPLAMLRFPPSMQHIPVTLVTFVLVCAILQAGRFHSASVKGRL